MLAAAGEETREEMRARWEREWAAEKERSEYGRTVADARKFVAKALHIQVVVRGPTGESLTFLALSRHAAKRSLELQIADQSLPSRFDPQTRTLIISDYTACDRAKS